MNLKDISLGTVIPIIIYIGISIWWIAKLDSRVGELEKWNARNKTVSSDIRSVDEQLEYMIREVRERLDRNSNLIEKALEKKQQYIHR